MVRDGGLGQSESVSQLADARFAAFVGRDHGYQSKARWVGEGLEDAGEVVGLPVGQGLSQQRDTAVIGQEWQFGLRLDSHGGGAHILQYAAQIDSRLFVSHPERIETGLCMGEIVMTDLASPDLCVTFTTEVAPGMHSAIIRAVKPAR